MMAGVTIGRGRSLSGRERLIKHRKNEIVKYPRFRPLAYATNEMMQQRPEES